jgi:hypothetical protein
MGDGSMSSSSVVPFSRACHGLRDAGGEHLAGPRAG